MKKPTAPFQVLRKAFKVLQKRNPQYSLRALSRDVGFSPSYVNRIMNGVKPLPLDQIDRFAEVLKMDEVAKLALKTVIHQPAFDDLGIVKNSNPAVFRYEENTAKEISILDQWFNITILDLSTCEDLPNDPEYVALRLGIQRDDAKRAIVFLIERGYFKIENGFLKKTEALLRFPTQRSHSSVRRYHQTMMSKAAKVLESTDQQSFDERLIAGISIATNKVNIAKAKARLHEVLFEICDILRDGKCDEVFQLSVQLFPVTTSVQAASRRAKAK